MGSVRLPDARAGVERLIRRRRAEPLDLVESTEEPTTVRRRFAEATALLDVGPLPLAGGFLDLTPRREMDRGQALGVELGSTKL